MSPAKPVLIFVPGAWHVIEHYYPIMDRLRTAGYEVKGKSLPSGGDDPAVVQSFDADVAVIRAQIMIEVERAKDVILVPHSYGGIPSSEACIGLSKEERQARGRKGAVVGIVYVAAFVLPVGTSVLSQMPGEKEPDWYQRNGKAKFTIPDIHKVFFHDIEYDVAKPFLDLCVPFAFSCMTSPVTYAAYERIPSWYIKPTKDYGFACKSIQFGADKHMKRVFEHVQTSHAPFVNAPGQIADVIRYVAGEDVKIQA